MGHLWGDMGQLWGPIGCYGALMGRYGAVMGSYGALMECYWAVMGRYRALMGHYGALMGRSPRTPQTFSRRAPRSPIHVLKVRSPDMTSSCAANHREELKRGEPKMSHAQCAGKRRQQRTVGWCEKGHRVGGAEVEETGNRSLLSGVVRRFHCSPLIGSPSLWSPPVYTLSRWFPPSRSSSPLFPIPLYPPFLGSSPHLPPSHRFPPLPPSHSAPTLRWTPLSFPPPPPLEPLLLQHRHLWLP